MRHGFGIAYFAENSYYFGRYENGLMTGVGINCLPNGDRFEGMFINNKPDGPGSYYERDQYTGNYSGQHAIFQLGRKIKDQNIPFTPTLADLPDDSNKVLSTLIFILAFDNFHLAHVCRDNEKSQSAKLD